MRLAFPSLIHRPSLRRAALFVALILAVAAPLWHIHVINRDMPYEKNDLVSRWVGSRAVLEQQSPYSAEVTREIQTAYYGRPLYPGEDVEPQEFAYPVYLALLMAPLTHMPIQRACGAFLVAVTPFLVLSFWLCVKALHLQASRTRAALIVVLALFSWPVIWGLRLQQLTLPVAALLFTAFFLLTRKQNAAAGVLLALAMIKPQLVLPLVLWLFVWAFLRRSGGLIASFTATFGLLLLWAELKLPGWIGVWREDIHNAYGPHTAMPLQTTFGHWIGLAATVLLVAYCAFQLWLLRHASPDSPEFSLAVALALATTLSFTLTKLPVIYNQILLIPGCLILLLSKSPEYYPALARRIAIAALIWGYATVYIAALAELLSRPSSLLDSLPFLDQIFPVMIAIGLTLKLPWTVKRGAETNEELLGQFDGATPK